MNNLKTVGLLAFMTTLLWVVVIAIGGSYWMGLAIAFGFNFLAYFFSDKMALAASRARPVTEEELPQVYAIVRRLAEQKKMPMPADLRHRLATAQRLRHRALAEESSGGGDHRDPPGPRLRRARRRARP